jgi:hypothetical protein
MYSPTKCLNIYRTARAWQLPVVFLGGNGGNMWFNMNWMKPGVLGDSHAGLNRTLAFEVFTYSYRGYRFAVGGRVVFMRPCVFS